MTGGVLHNAVVSNMVADDRDNLQFVAGYGRPYRVELIICHSPRRRDLRRRRDNFVWVQWGQDLSDKDSEVSPRPGIGVGMRFRIWRVQ